VSFTEIDNVTDENKLIRVAVDAMGGDYAPAEIVEGAILAAREGDVQVMLVGDPDKVQSELAKHDTARLPIAAIPSEGAISEGEQPVLALRQKPRASVLVATGMVKQGHVDACVTMGSTGAAMAAAAVVLGMIDGIDRPALGGPIFGLAPRTVVIDLGTNVDCRPAQLLSFGVIGDVFARQFWGVEWPRVGILSVGAEAGKGNRQVKEASELFTGSGLNFIGNVEANEIMQGKAEVVVCDGFVGNVVMKLTEGLGQALSDYLRTRLKDRLSESEVEEIAEEVYGLNNQPEAKGGGPLFGVNGVSIVGHGRARAGAVQRAIGTAKLLVERDFIPKLNEELARLRTRTEK
jgi:glycerol-3-phosphate acyltransferase PlsX